MSKSDSTFVPMDGFNQRYTRHGVPALDINGERFPTLKKAIAFVENKVGKKKGYCVGVSIKEYMNAGNSVFEYRRAGDGWQVWTKDGWAPLDESETGSSVVIDSDYLDQEAHREAEFGRGRIDDFRDMDY